MNPATLPSENSPNYSIRQATTADLERIIKIWKQGLSFAIGTNPLVNEEDDQKVKTHFEANIHSQNDAFKFWVYVSPENEIISWCSIMPFHPNPLLQNAWGIMSMYIDSAYQNKMHGYHFSKFVLEECSHTSIRYVLSIVAASNERVIRLSKKMGFVTLGRIPHTQVDNDLVETELMLFEA